MQPFGRRVFLGSSLSVLCEACAGANERLSGAEDFSYRKRILSAENRLAAWEEELGGRVGVFAMSRTATLTHRANERFALCSTFKWALAAEVLRRSDQGELALAEQLSFGPQDIQEWSPVVGPRAADGQMRIDELARAAVTMSDNTATNLLMRRLEGPASVTRFFRELGDEQTRLDRIEPELNENAPGDTRDTTTPRAMCRALRTTIEGSILSSFSRKTLVTWLVESQTGLDRLRAGFSTDTRAGNKTGTGPRGATNDLAVAWPRSGEVIYVASYLSGSSAPLSALVETHSRIGRLVETTLS